MAPVAPGPKEEQRTDQRLDCSSREIISENIPEFTASRELSRELSDLPSLSPYPGTVELLQGGYRYALSLTHHKANAEDLVQDACLKLFRRYGELRSRSLLFVAIRRLYIDRLRQPYLLQSEEMPEQAEPVTPITTENGTAEDLNLLLSQLRPVEREALYLHHVEGYTAQEIADLTRSSRNTVLSLLHRGLRKLQNAGSHAS